MKRKTGPTAEAVKVTGADWKDAIRHALNKPKPAEGWPKPEAKPKAKKTRKGQP